MLLLSWIIGVYYFTFRLRKYFDICNIDFSYIENFTKLICTVDLVAIMVQNSVNMQPRHKLKNIWLKQRQYARRGRQLNKFIHIYLSDSLCMIKVQLYVCSVYTTHTLTAMLRHWLWCCPTDCDTVPLTVMLPHWLWCCPIGYSQLCPAVTWPSHTVSSVTHKDS